MSIDDYRLPPLQQQTPAEQYDAMIGVVEQAEQQGVLATLPTHKAEVNREALMPARVNTIRTRLFLLDYLREDKDSGTIDRKLQDAIRRFQTDAALTVDGWVGPETWSALQELVGFETPLNTARWLPTADAPLNPALKRAVRLRLYVHGFLANRRTRHDKHLRKALKAFVEIAGVLGLGTTPLQPTFTAPTLVPLFDQDAILQRLAFLNERPIPADAVKAVKQFMVANAKIELWMRGYNVEPDGKTAFVTAQAPGTLYSALIDYWKDRGVASNRVQAVAREISFKVFQNMFFLDQEADQVPDTQTSAVLYANMVRLAPAQQNSVWETVKRVGSSIWDGLKRAWRWFKAMIKKGIQQVARWTKNLARLVYRYAHQAFLTVTKTVGRLTTALQDILPRTFPGSDPGQIVIRRDGDFDYQLFINRNADPARVQALTARLQREARIFRLGVHVLRLLIGAVIDTVKKVLLGGGWFGFLLALVQLFKHLKALKAVLDESRAFLATV